VLKSVNQTRVGLKAGKGNGEMRNEEMEKWKHLCMQNHGQYIGRKLTGKAGRLVFMVLVVWPARLFS